MSKVEAACDSLVQKLDEPGAARRDDAKETP